LAQYASVNSQAESTASQPFQTYSGQFVAPTTQTQNAGIAGTTAAANEAQPYIGAATNTLGATQANTTGVNNAATGLAAASAGPVNAQPLTGQQINSYLSPYLGDVLGSTEGIQEQENAQQQTGALGTAISSGAFGGDRTGIAAANLEQQQDLANSSVISGIANQGYVNAQGVAQQQQGVNLGAAQANRAALGTAGSELASIGSTAYGEGSNTASELAGLGTTGQTAGLQGASAELQAGTVQQQTQQAQDTAEYNQFLQQQSYPFQVDQFLANIAEGTGALSGSTTTTTQPGGFFSDKRLKHDIKKIGETFDGQPIYSYKMHGDNRTHVGLIAQNVEKKHPDAVGLAAGYKTVDYGKATEKAANRGHFYAGGVAGRGTYAYGGSPSVVSPTDLSAILAAQQQMYAPMSGGAGVYGGVAGGVPRGGSSRVPQPSGATPHLVTAEGSLRTQPTGMQNVTGAANLAQQGQRIYKDTQTPSQGAPASTGPTYDQGVAAGMLPATNAEVANDPDMQALQDPQMARGGVAGRRGYDAGGMPYSSDPSVTTLDIPDENSHNSLSKPAALPKPSPTGFQQLMSMGQGMGGSSGMSGMFSGMGGGSGAGGAGASGGADVTSDAFSAYHSGGPVGEPRARGVVPRVSDHWRVGKDGGGVAGDAVDADSTDRQTDVGDAPDTSVMQATPLAQGAPNTSLDSVKHLALAAGEAYVGDYAGAADQAYQAYGSTQTNNHSRGGVAGRRGYDEGGDVAEQADDTDAAPAAPSGGGVAGWWDRNKGNVLPALSGLAAMGTAPTRHLGVALAAGLGAGAASYVPTQQGIAETQQTKARTQGVDIANQIAQQKLNYLKAPPPSSAPISPMAPPGSYAPADLRKQYYVPPVTQDEQAKLQFAYKQAVALGSSQPVDAAKAAIQNRVQSQTAANNNDARQNYDDAYSVATKAQDPTLRASAASVADAYSQWTGDKNEDRGGVLINSRTNKPPVGDQAQRLSPSKYADLMNEAMTKVPVPTGVPGETKLMPKWQVNGGNSAADYVSKLPPTGTPGVGTAPTAAAPAPVRAAAPISTTPRRSAQTPISPTPASGPPANPVDAKAFSDPKYKLAPIPTQIGTTPSDAVVNQMKQTSESRAKLQDDAESTAQSSAAALQYAQAAKQIMDSKGAPTVGLLGPMMKTITGVFGGVNATNYQEVAKYLGNLAVQTGKGNFSNTTDKNTALQFEQLNPSTANTEDALNGLLSSNIRTNQYALDTANRATGYLDPKYNGDPQKFFRWNQEHYPRADVINAADPKSATEGALSVTKGGRPMAFTNGKWRYRDQ
jgi:hypothetical protein